MSTLVAFTIPFKEAGIERIFEQLVKIALLKRSARFGANDFAQLHQGMIARRIELKDALGNGRILFLNFNCVIELVIRVPQGRAAG
ncbi:MAG TPA: hypothetical protein VGH51_07645 [Candidatus Angelobacter sp.]